jgi:uncharacterized membrane protein YqaE (UPF0057 family)
VCSYSPAPSPAISQLTPLVWIKRGICSGDSLLNILLSCVGYLPGLIHAWYIIARYPDEDLGYEAISEEGGHVTYYYVSREPVPHGGPAAAGTGGPDAGRAQREQQRGANTYGTVGGEPQQGTIEGPAAAPTPPTYAEAVKGDHKIQTDH